MSFSSASIVLAGELDRPQRPIGQRRHELRLDPRTAVAREKIANLGDDGARHENPAACEVQRGEQVHALAMAGVVLDRGSDEWSRVADDHG